MPNWWPVDIRYEDETLRLTSPKGVCVKSCRHRKVQEKKMFVIVICKPLIDIQI